MKVAVCLSGQMRSYKDCYDNLMKYIIKPLNADIFLHTWTEVGSSHKENRDTTEIVSKNLLQKMYKPKKLEIEEHKIEYNDELLGKKVPNLLKKTEPVHYKSALPMYYQIYKSFKLLEEYVEQTQKSYDIVIRIRPDSMFLEEIPKHLLKKSMKEKNLLYYADYAINTNIQICDKFAFGGYEAMKYYCSLWLNITQYWENPLGDNPPHTHRVGERLMKYHIESNSNIKAIPVYIDMYNLRLDGEKLHYKGTSLKKQYLRDSDSLSFKIKNILNKLNVNRKDFLFIHIPKVAGSSIEKALYGTKGKVTHKLAIEHRKENENLFEKKFKFGFVRNPYDRFISAYEYLRQGGRNDFDRSWSEKYLLPYKSFDDFVLSLENEDIRQKIINWIHFKPQYLFVCDEKKNLIVNFIGKYENLEEDFNLIQKRLGLSIKLPYENKTPTRKDFKIYFNDKTKKIIEDIYKDDFELFDYKKGL